MLIVSVSTRSYDGVRNRGAEFAANFDRGERGMMSVLLLLAVQSAAVPPEPPIAKACIRDNSIEVSKGAAQKEWNEAWRKTLMLCRSVRQAWFSWKFEKLKSEHPNWSDEGMANTIERLLEEF